MVSNRFPRLMRSALLACGLLTMVLSGCQTDVGGQTLPSAYFLRDDVQYFPSGPEMMLHNTVRAHEEYRLRQDAAELGDLPQP